MSEQRLRERALDAEALLDDAYDALRRAMHWAELESVPVPAGESCLFDDDMKDASQTLIRIEQHRQRLAASASMAAILSAQCQYVFATGFCCDGGVGHSGEHTTNENALRYPAMPAARCRHGFVICEGSPECAICIRERQDAESGNSSNRSSGERACAGCGRDRPLKYTHGTCSPLCCRVVSDAASEGKKP